MTARPLRLGPDGRLDGAETLAVGGPGGAPLLDDPRLARVLDLLNRDGEEARVVGGAVRNALLGLPPGDIDVATTAPPEAVMARAKAAKVRAVPTGIDHGTVTLVSSGLPVEVTTLREDVETDGRHAVVRFGRDFGRDAERRDFTMNALSLGRDGTVHDTVGGIDDLAAGRVRFIGDAATRIREDYLRVLRFFRFHATYGVGPLDAGGLAASAAHRDGLDRLSRERVRTEVLKLLAAPGAAPVLAEMDGAGLLAPVLGGPADVARAARLDPGADPLLRLAALAVRGEGDVERLREALRLSNAERDRLLAALRVGTPSAAPGTGAVRALLFDHGRAATADALALARSAATDEQGWDEASKVAADAPVPVMPFSGKDVVARGLKGPAIGEALARFRAAYRAAGFPEGEAERLALLEDGLAPLPPRG